MSKYKEFDDIIQDKAREYDVIPDIHDHDFIFQFLVENKSFKSVNDAINYYFMDGRKSARKLSGFIGDLNPSNGENIKVLEFASGYGCVTRHFNNELPGIDITSCDIHDDAVRFIESKLEGKAILSHAVPELLKLDVQYDVVFALSFFSHMPKSTWSRWLKSLASCTKKNGYILFTTQGIESRKYFGNPELDNEGFWFKSESEQKDLDTSEYGQTIVSPKYVFSAINNLNLLELNRYYKSNWWGHQDLYIVQRIV